MVQRCVKPWHSGAPLRTPGVHETTNKLVVVLPLVTPFGAGGRLTYIRLCPLDVQWTLSRRVNVFVVRVKDRHLLHLASLGLGTDEVFDIHPCQKQL